LIPFIKLFVQQTLPGASGTALFPVEIPLHCSPAIVHYPFQSNAALHWCNETQYKGKKVLPLCTLDSFIRRKKHLLKITKLMDLLLFFRKKRNKKSPFQYVPAYETSVSIM
jgi:hypothetical protein